MVRLWDSFKHSGPNGVHVCMLFEPMGPNLLALIKHYNYRGIPMDMVRSITRQVNPRKKIQKKNIPIDMVRSITRQVNPTKKNTKKNDCSSPDRSPLPKPKRKPYTRAHTHTHSLSHTIYICMCVCIYI